MSYELLTQFYNFISRNEIVLSSSVGVVISLFAAIISDKLRYLVSNKLLEQKEKLSQIITEREIDIKVSGISNVIVDNLDSFNKDDLRENLESSILEKLKENPEWSKDDIREEINSELNALESRLQEIEKRFPDKSSIDKIASINDAIFAERLEALSKRLDDLELANLSKWDVAVIVSTIIGGIFAVVGATYGVIAFIQSSRG